MYKLILYNIDILEVKQKNRIIHKKVYRYLITLHNIPYKETTLKYIDTYNKYIKEYKNLCIHLIKENEKDHLLNGCYLYNKDGTYQKYYYKKELI